LVRELLFTLRTYAVVLLLCFGFECEFEVLLRCFTRLGAAFLLIRWR
jgi:hypothetical protein